MRWPRSLLAKAILSSNVKEQVELIGKLAETESEIVPTVLNAWREGKVFVHEAPDGQKVPFLRTNGKATRIDDGSPIEAPETTPVESTTKLRKAMKNTLDVLTIAGPDPQGRRAAITKLGMTQNAAYLPVFEARLALEKDPSVVTPFGSHRDYAARRHGKHRQDHRHRLSGEEPRHSQSRSRSRSSLAIRTPQVAAAAKKGVARVSRDIFAGSRFGGHSSGD